MQLRGEVEKRESVVNCEEFESLSIFIGQTHPANTYTVDLLASSANPSSAAFLRVSFSVLPDAIGEVTHLAGVDFVGLNC